MVAVWASWSPGGQMIAVSGRLYDASNNDHFGLFLLRVNGQSKPKLLSRTAAENSAPLWSPDGKTIAFSFQELAPAVQSSLRTGIAGGDAGDDVDRIPKPVVPTPPSPMRSIHLIRADGSGEKQLTSPSLRIAYPAAWSLDGKKIYAVLGGGITPFPERAAASAAPPASPFVIHLINVDGSGDTPITPADRSSGNPVVSPDGERTAFQSSHIFIANQDGSGARQVTNDPDWGCGNLSWSPDGKQIAFSCQTRASHCPGGVFLAGRFPCVRRLFVISPDDPPAKLVPITDHDVLSPSFAPRP